MTWNYVSRSLQWITASFVVIAAIAAIGFSAPAMQAPPRPVELRDGVAETAKLVQQFLRGKGQTSVAVGQFTGPAKFPGTSANISKILIEELQKLRVAVAREAALEIKGDYTTVRDKDQQFGNQTIRGQPLLRLRVRILNSSDGATLTEFTKDIDNEVDIASNLGVTGQLSGPAAASAATVPLVPQDVGDLVSGPSTVAVSASRILPKAGSPFAIEVLVKSGSDYVARTPEVRSGLAFAPLRRDEVFAIRLINDSPNDTIVNLTLDGLSVFAFSQEFNEKTPGYQIRKKSQATIVGWHKTNKSAFQFVITDYPKSAAAELLSKSNDIGTITATFRSVAYPMIVGNKPGLGVGKGAETKTDFETANVFPGGILAVVTARYESE